MFQENFSMYDLSKQKEKNYYIAQELLRLLLLEEKDTSNRKEIIDIFNQLVSYPLDVSL